MAATDSGALWSAAGIRPLSDGRVLVNDATRRRLVLFDQTLKRFIRIADTAVGAPVTYGTFGAVTIPFLADSTVLLDQQARAFVVISPGGRIVRTMAMGSAADVTPLISGWASNQTFDNKGRLILAVIRPRPKAVATPVPDSGLVSVEVTFDSLAVIRRDPDSGRADTTAIVGTGAHRMWTFHLGGGRSPGVGAHLPCEIVDDWAVMSDGTVAVVRGHDYHIDWVAPDGTRTASPKMPFDWRRIADDEKQRIVDSANAEARARIGSRATPQSSLVPARPTPLPTASIHFETSDVPDYIPPVRVTTTRADPAGDLWVLPATSSLAGDGLVYDVVDRKGTVVERVRLPRNRTLAAIGSHREVYMLYSSARNVTQLERGAIEPPSEVPRIP